MRYTKSTIKDKTILQLRKLAGYKTRNNEHIKEDFDGRTISKLNHDELVKVLSGARYEKTKSSPAKKFPAKKSGTISFCFTGTLSYPRNELITSAIIKGGVVKTTVTKNLDYLVTNNPYSGSKKIIDSYKFGVRIISEKQFFDLLRKL